MSYQAEKFQDQIIDLLKGNNVTKPPVPVEKIAAHLGIVIRYSPTKDDLSGALIRNSNEVVIGVNSAHHEHRQRFTIAHEIGHFLLHEGMQLHVDQDFRINLRDSRSSTAEDVEEIDANRFAAQLLMPFQFIWKDARRLSPSEADLVKALAPKYVVSPRAMELRLRSLGFTSPF
jgi:Zn-dependent peptidase ImmA (M78 family)